MAKVWAFLGNALQREPVYLGAAVLATVQAFSPPAAIMVALTAWTAWAVRAASKSKVTAAEDAEIARYAGILEGQQRAEVTDPT